MRLIKIWLVGGITGVGTALSFLLATQLFSLDGDLNLAEFAISLITPSIIYVVTARITNTKLVVLLTVGYLTLVMPILGPLFGMGDLSVRLVIGLAILGLLGGLFWSIPFVFWEFRNSSKND